MINLMLLAQVYPSHVAAKTALAHVHTYESSEDFMLLPTVAQNIISREAST